MISFAPGMIELYKFMVKMLVFRSVIWVWSWRNWKFGEICARVCEDYFPKIGEKIFNFMGVFLTLYNFN